MQKQYTYKIKFTTDRDNVEASTFTVSGNARGNMPSQMFVKLLREGIAQGGFFLESWRTPYRGNKPLPPNSIEKQGYIMKMRTRVIRLLAEFVRETHGSSIKDAVDEASFFHDLVFQAIDLTDSKEEAIKVMATYFAGQGEDASEAETLSSYAYTLVTTAIYEVVPQSKTNPVTVNVGKFPTDFSKPIVDASNATSVDLMGGPEAVKF